MIASALLVMLVTQAVVVAASLAVPVLAPQMSAALELRPEVVGYYTSVIFIGAVISAQFSAAAVARFGAVATSQGAAILAAAGVMMAATAGPAGVAISALLIGLAYAPGNPASSSLLSAVTPRERRAFVFSTKQTAVPIGAAMAGGALPLVAGTAGWPGALGVAAATAVLTALAVEPWRKRLDGRLKAERAAAGAGPPAGAPLRLVRRHPALSRLAAVAGSMASLQFSVSSVFVTFLVEVAELSLPAAGGLLLAAMAASVGLRIMLGHVADRVGASTVLRAIAAIMLVASLSSALAAAGMVGGATLVVAATVVLGAAAFSWNGIYLSEVAAAAPAGAVGAATAGTMTFVFVGGIFGPAAFSAATLAAGSFAGGFLLVAVFAAAALAALSIRLPEERPAPGQ